VGVEEGGDRRLERRDAAVDASLDLALAEAGGLTPAEAF
jgi:hypothetical protein